MKYPKWFARWRVTVWDKRLASYRREWQLAIEHQDDHQHPEAFAAVNVDAFWERLVTKALAKRVLWRKRAGIRKAVR